MGQRTNYIIKEGESISIYYNHWRANCIIPDLYLGPKRFIDFVKSCKPTDEILVEPWIEGCVIIDFTSQQLCFWTQHYPSESSVMDYYLTALAKKWNGWDILFLKNRMYEVEKILEIDYINQQELISLRSSSLDDIQKDTIEGWETAVIVIVQNKEITITKTGNLDIENVIGYGEDIIPLLLSKPRFSLPYEKEDVTYSCIIIDIEKKKLYINQSIFGLWEQSKYLWNEYILVMGDFGYIKTLRLAGINTDGLEISADEVTERFKEITKPVDGFDPIVMAERLQQEHDDIKFNPDFFDSVKPKKTLLEMLGRFLKNLLNRKT